MSGSYLQILDHDFLAEHYLNDGSKNHGSINCKLEIDDYYKKCKKEFIIKNRYDFLPNNENTEKYIDAKFGDFMMNNSIKLSDYANDDFKYKFIKKYFGIYIRCKTEIYLPNNENTLTFIDEIYEKYNNIK